MSTTVIDALLVTLGLDPRQFVRGASDANKAQVGIGRTAAKTTSETEHIERRQADARRARNKEVEANSRKISEGVKSARNEALRLFAVFAVGSGLKNFIGDTLGTAVQLGYLSANLKTSTEDITAWQRASERAGGSKEGIVAQLQESARDLAALKSGMGPSENMQWFFRMGGSSSDLKDGNTYLLARAKIVHDLFQVDPSRASLMAAQMGISEDQFNFIKQGPAAILALVDAQRKNSAITAQDAANALVLRNRWLDFKDSMQATATKILVAMIPAFEQLVMWLQKGTAWITDNKDAIGRWVADMVAKAIPVLEAIGSAIAGVDWKSAVSGVKTVASAIVGLAEELRELLALWKKWTGRETPTEGVIKLPGAIRMGKAEDLAIDDERNGRKPKPPAPKPTGVLGKISDGIEEALARTLASFGNKAAAEYIRDTTGKDDYLAGPKVDKTKMEHVVTQLNHVGWTKEQAMGIASNLAAESGFNPNAVGDGGKAYGIAQWHPDRQAEFKAIVGKDMRGSSLDDQLWFLNHELTNGKEQAAGVKLRATKTAAEAARVISDNYERPDDKTGAKATARAAAAARMSNDAMKLATPAKAPVAHPSTSQTDVKVGAVTINTAATDAEGIARDFASAVNKASFGYVAQSNTGVA